MGLGRLCTIALLASSTTVWGQTIQKPGLAVPASAAAHKADVVNIFNASYTAYKKYAWGHDDLLPVSKSFSDGRNGWGASIADALGTMYIMGMTDFFEEAVNFTGSVDFSKSQTSDNVSVFETSIRYLGGYLSAYELSGAKYPVLLEKAKEVADKMAYAWSGKSAIQFNTVDFSTNAPVIDTTGIAAAALTLEYYTLSKHTGNDTYRQLAEGTVKAIMALPAPLPGLPAQGIDPSTGQSVGGYVTWGGGSDSYFEYLIKYGRLTNSKDSSFVAAWQTAVDTSIKTLLRNSTVGNHLYLADYNEGDILHVGSHLACFYGGNWLMGGKMLNNQTIVNYGLQLTDACWNTYQSTLTGIGPESFSFISSDGDYTGGGAAPTATQLAFYEQHGFYITGSDYILRPEVLESNFYAYRVTGDKKYLDRAVSAVKSIKTFLPTTVAYTGINDVNAAASAKIDDMESFWFAEVLKYLYLTFDDPSHISLDDWVFNTECHPFKAPATAASYATTTTMPAPAAAFKVLPGNPPVVSPNPLVPAAVKKILHMRRGAEHH